MQVHDAAEITVTVWIWQTRRPGTAKNRIAGFEQEIKVGCHQAGDSASSRKVEQHLMGVEFRVWRRSDGLRHRRADIRNLELLLEQSEDPIRGHKATDARHWFEGKSAFQENSSATVLRRAQTLDHLARQTSKAREARLFLAYARAAKEYDIPSVARDEKFVRYVWAICNEPHGLESNPEHAGAHAQLLSGQISALGQAAKRVLIYIPAHSSGRSDRLRGRLETRGRMDGRVRM
jgi:hypothetical protein